MRMRVLRQHIGDSGMVMQDQIIEADPVRTHQLVRRGLVEVLPDAPVEAVPAAVVDAPMQIVIGGSQATDGTDIVCPECGSRCRDDKTFAAHMKRAHTFRGARGK